MAACPSCGGENPRRGALLHGLRRPLERRCASCGEPAPAEARFCMACGAGTRRPGDAGRPPRRVRAEERRQVTVLFADLSGYTAIAEGMDPEAVKSMVERWLLRLGEEVERFGGTVDKYIGDNVMALFGAPVAHEDDAERAVRAALGMQDAMDELNARLPGIRRFALRVGVNTGEVMAGAVGDRYTVTGDTVNVASRLESAGRPGSVTVGERTVRATRHAVAYGEIGELTLKGKAKPVAAWEATGADRTARRCGGRHRAESPLVGRERELELLRLRRAGGPRGPRAHGHAGRARPGWGSRACCASSSAAGRDRAGGAHPDGPLPAVWVGNRLLGAQRGHARRGGHRGLRQRGRRVGQAARPRRRGAGRGARGRRRAARRQIGASLGLGVPASLAPPGSRPERSGRTFFSALRIVRRGVGGAGPVVLAFEDIHWADDGMLDAIEHLARWVRAPLLVVCLARDELLERRSGWGGGRLGATQLFLDPLSDASVA